MLDIKIPVNRYRIIINKFILEMIKINNQGERTDNEKV